MFGHKRAGDRYVSLDVNSLYGYAMSQLDVPLGKPELWSQGHTVTDSEMCSAFVVRVNITYLPTVHHLKIRTLGMHVVNNIDYFELMRYGAQMTIIEGLIWTTGSSNVLRTETTKLLEERFDINCDPERRQVIKQTLNTVHGLLNRRTKPMKIEFEDDPFGSANAIQKALTYVAKNRLLINKIVRKNSQVVVYKNISFDLNFTNTLIGSLIRSKAKQIMNKYFDYCCENGIRVYYSNTDSIQIKRHNLQLMQEFINPNVAGMLKIET
jgi:hypothetical protein